MTHALALEDFSKAATATAPAGFDAHALTPPEPSVDNLETAAEYEKGYIAGYEDAMQSAMREQSRIKTELAHNLQDIGFTFHEARAHVMRSLEPLLQEIADKFLPELVRETLAQHVIEAALPLARDAADAPIEVVTAPANRAALEPVLTSIAHMNFVMKEEPSLGEGQVYLQSRRSELSVSFSDVIDNVRAALAALNDINKEAVRHG